jgi:hypothetical protein
VDKAHQGLPQFIANIQQEVIIFIDEFEKVYQEYSSEVLTIMDGVYKTGYKRLFLLTTNNLYINQNMLQRPGRIRYVKTYGDLELPVVKEIIDDLLLYPEFRADCLEAISTLEIITIDLVKAIINEVNIHVESPTKFMDVFNVTSGLSDDIRKSVEVVEVTNNPNVTPLEIKNAYLYASLERLCEGYQINTEREPAFIKITEKYSKDTFKIKLYYNLVTKAELERTYDDDDDDETQYFYSSTNDKTPNVIKLDNGDVLIPVGTDETDATIVERIVKITEKKTKHYSFNSMAF